MHIEGVDPRDGTWEMDEPVFRVYLWDRNTTTSHEHEITDATIDEVLAWAREKTREPGWAYTAYLRIDLGGRGLARIDGVVGDPFQIGDAIVATGKSGV